MKTNVLEFRSEGTMTYRVWGGRLDYEFDFIIFKASMSTGQLAIKNNELRLF